MHDAMLFHAMFLTSQIYVMVKFRVAFNAIAEDAVGACNEVFDNLAVTRLLVPNQEEVFRIS